MDKVFCKQPFMKLQLLVITGITVFMFIPPTFGCEITEVTLYAGADVPDAEEADCEIFYIGKNGDVVFHAICEGVTNPDELDIKWIFNFDNGGSTVDCTEETSYTTLKATSSIIANYDTAGTKAPSVTCYLIDSEGNQVSNSVSDTCTVHVVSVDIQMQSLLEEHEEDPGAFVGLNDNDNDGDGLTDRTDTVITGGDPDLIPATLSITPSSVDVGEIVLSPSTGTTIKVYENQDKSGGPKYSWDLSSASTPITVYVEGFETGTENLKMTFKYDNDDDGDDDELCDDQVKVTVVRADLDIYNGQSGSLAPETDKDNDAIEDEEDIGAFTVANLNDTNGDGTVDNAQNPVDANGNLGRDEIDLMQLVLNKPSPDCGGDVKLTILSGDVAIWSEPNKADEIETSDFEFPVSDFMVRSAEKGARRRIS